MMRLRVEVSSCGALLMGLLLGVGPVAQAESVPMQPSLVPLVAAIRPAVVTIEGPSGSLGSGVVVRADGQVVTNKHIAEAAGPLVVKSVGGRSWSARVAAVHEDADLALLAIEPETPLSALPLGDSAAVQVGEWVVAIGNPFGLGITVSVGVIGATGRSLGKTGPGADVFQTDAAINPGNSGGPLCNLAGEVIAIASSAVTVGQGIGFAVPSALVRELLATVDRKAEGGSLLRGRVATL